MPVGEIFLSAFLQVLFEKLASGLIVAFAKKERICKLLREWRENLEMIQAVIDDAEDRQLAIEAVKLWLEQLRDLAYDLDDVLDEILTEALIQKSNDERRTGKEWNSIRFFMDYTPGAFMFKKRMRSKIEEISTTFKSVVKFGNRLNLTRYVGGPSHQSINRVPSTSVIEPHVYGREKDREVFKLVTCTHNEVSVIPIVGMGGIGKTTLAQLIYNDEIVTGTFDIKVWVCVSEKFDVFTITKIIFHSVTNDSTESKDLNMLQEILRRKLSTKKFLLILDDVWNEDREKWKTLFLPFSVGLPGSKVLVTTRSEKIAKMMGSVPFYPVKRLSTNDCQSLLAQHAFEKKNFDEHPNLKSIGEALAKKCDGLPLAARTLGGLLKSEKRLEQWEDVLNSKIWDLRNESNIIPPVLRLSYHHLPSNLKHLFAYCSIFPKNYEFDKLELVLLWMGEGFLAKPKGKKTKEQLGIECFNELLARSFFQPLCGSSSHFVMHDLINDLAQFVAGVICYKLDEKVETNNEYEISERTRHASFLRHEYEVFRKFTGFYRVKGLRTFLPMPVQNIHVWPPFYLSNRILFELLPKSRRMRVLSLSGYSITELPRSICALIHMRYLNLSGTSIVQLPESLSDLYNLETLSICNCRLISKLPPSIGDLANLRHLDNSNTDQLKELPAEIGKLRNLQTLPKIVHGKAGFLGLKELRHFEVLGGAVAISELQNVMDIEDAKEASMRYKQELEELQLMWANKTDVARDARLEEDVLDALHPHKDLRNLKIEFYGGVKFPNWVGDPSFDKLFSVSLKGCTKCTSLPSLGQLNELKHLWIEDMSEIRYIDDQFGTTFPKLKTLRFARMPEWEKWSFPANQLQQFPCLQQLTIFECPKLTIVSPINLPVLHELDIEECSMVILKSFRNLDLINYLKVVSVTGLSHLPMELVQAMVTLEVLELSNCNELDSVWPNGFTSDHLDRLRRLIVADCPLLVSLGKSDQKLPSNLEILELFQCEYLTSLPDNLFKLRSLRELIIKKCPKIVSFPEHGIPPTLKRLEVLSCKALESLPNDIPNLERLEINDCSSLKKWSKGIFPRSLKKLSIKNCDKLDSVSEPMFGSIFLEDLSIQNWLEFGPLLQNVNNFSSLTELYLSHCIRLEHFPEQGLPPNLRTLYVLHCSKLKSFPTHIQHMSSMVSIEICSCRRLQNFPSCDFPPNLSSLRILDSRKLKPLSEWGLHRLNFLQEFSICGGFQKLQSFDNEVVVFPSSLIKFSIARFPQLNSLSNVLENLSSLQHLSVMNCTMLNVLPSEKILENLRHLEISECPPLKQRCLKDKGKYWPKISGIPCVQVDGTYIYRQC